MTHRRVTYGVEDSPPAPVLLALGIQHLFGNVAGWVLMAGVFASFAATVAETASMLRMGMIAVGVGAILQALRRGPVGAGVLCPPIGSPAYASASVLAGANYGLPTLFGMTLLGGLFEVLLARLLPRLRALFPPYVIGAIMIMVGAVLIPIAIPRMLGDASLGSAIFNGQAPNLAVGLVTLGTTVAVTVRARGSLRLYPSLAGTLAGWLLAYYLGCISPQVVPAIAAAEWFAVPERAASGLSFAWPLLVPFLIAATASMLKGVGDLAVCQRMNAGQQTDVDLVAASKGSTALGLASALGGLLGTMGHSGSSTNVALAMASGATSRRIGFVLGALLIGLAFLPRAALAIATLPAAVMGGILTFTAATMILAGVQVMGSCLMDSRRILLSGLAISFGLSSLAMPQLYSNVSPVLQPIFLSPVSLTAVLAIGLNLLFSIGTTKVLRFSFDMDRFQEASVLDRLTEFGESVGAPKEAVRKAGDAVAYAVEALQSGLAQGAIETSVEVEDAQMFVELRYSGKPVPLPKTALSVDAAAADLAALSGYLLVKRASGVELFVDQDRCRLRMRFAF